MIISLAKFKFTRSRLITQMFTFSGVYELRMYDIVLGKSEQWAHRFVQGLPDRCKLSEPVGVWFTEFGQVNTGMFLDKPFIVD